MTSGRVRNVYKLTDIAEQPGGLETLNDDELRVLVEHLRVGLAAAEASKRGKKARRDWRERLDRSETELARRAEGA
jgi:hypothetical protein